MGGAPTVGTLFNVTELEQLLGFGVREKHEELGQNHFDLAHSVQQMYEEAFFNMLQVSYSKYGNDQLSLAGGCAMNSLANGKIFRNSPYKKVYIQSAAGDAGGAIGAALFVASQNSETEERFHMDHAYYGPSFDDNYHQQVFLQFLFRPNQFQFSSCILNELMGFEFVYNVR